MKKCYFMMAAFATMLAFTACSNEENIATVDEETVATLGEGEGLIEISVKSANSGSRTVRPLGSSAAANDVDNVQVKIYKKASDTWTEDTNVKVDGYETSNLINDWSASKSENKYDESHDDNKTVKLEGLAANTQYKIVAYGYNGTAPTATDAQGVFTVNSVTSVEEVFAGEIEVTTNGNGKFSAKQELEMDRQVAGLLAYFGSVPTRINDKVVKKVIVNANAKSAGFKFPWSADFNGVTTTTGKTALLTFEMSKMATNYNDGIPTDATYTFNKVTNGAAEGNGSKPFANEYTLALQHKQLTLEENTIFGACYLLPYDNHIESQTLTVELWGDDTNAPLKTLNVTTTKFESPATKNAYDIRRNNFYSIGRKMKSDTTDGPDGEDDDENPDQDPDDEDDDDPIQLGESDEIMLLVNDAWDVLHNMGVEESTSSSAGGNE